MSFPISRLSALAAAVVTLAASLVTLVGAAAPAAAYPADSVQFEGHGWGHGRGLGQYGSLGYSVDEGEPYGDILDHYYGGTTKGTQADGPITVRLTEFDSKDMILTSKAAFTVDTTAMAAGTAARVHRAATTYEISTAATCAGPWTRVGTTAKPVATTTYAGDDVTQMLRTCGPTGNVRSYRGSLAMVSKTAANAAQTADTSTTLPGTTLTSTTLPATTTTTAPAGIATWVVNTVGMEQYLRGVVPRESPASWGDSGGGKGINALKAQAVSARSYAWAEDRSPGLFKTCDTTSCQVYGGAGLNGVRIEDSRSDRAVAETAGEVRILGGRVARTEFSSSTGGYTAGGTFTAVPDSGDDVSSNPNHTWSTSVPVTKVQQAYPTVGTLQSIVVSVRNGLGQDSGRAKTVKITGSKTTVTTTGDDVRSKLGLKSDWFYVADPTLNAPAVGLAGSGTGFVLTSTIGEVMSGAGGATFGSQEGKPIPKGTTIVAVATTATGQGYWLVGTDGSVYRFGDAADIGTLRGRTLSKPIVGLARTKTGLGLWLVGSDGAVYPLGDATDLGSMAGKPLNSPMLGMAADPDGDGYWLLARDGGVFSFNAKFYGSTGSMRLNKPILGMTADPQGHGYWFTASDGGVFTFIDQPGRFYGSAGGTAIKAPIVGMAATPTGAGYWLLGRDGAIFKYGDAT
ncbi:MAG: hypothetical protein JWO68_3044 [Actinomycetia bacterium]|nr:hypothetical protein [Actinomycetes bacterium]